LTCTVIVSVLKVVNTLTDIRVNVMVPRLTCRCVVTRDDDVAHTFLAASKAMPGFCI
jgi:hypothetical protein